MVRAGKKLFINITILFFTLLIISGCSQTSVNMNIDEIHKTKEYKDISKDAIFEAAKKAFVFTGGDAFLINSYRNKLNVTRTKMNHYPFYAVTYEDRWNFTIEEKDNTSYVKLDIKRVHDFDESDIEYFTKNLHLMMWDKIDYFLGLKKQWHTCVEFFKYYDFTDEAVCDTIDLNPSREPNPNDIVRNILISERKSSKTVSDVNNDVLDEDIVFTIEDTKTDILEKEDKIDDTNVVSDEILDELDLEIEKLDKQVSDNIDETLKEIKQIEEN